ncbi:MAG: biosynthetic peptidoglycan transglycosylase [Proteocatella sp.]
MKKLISMLCCLLLILSISFGMAAVFPIVQDGYEMYEEKTSEINIDTMIKEVEYQENYLKLEDISDEFIEQLLKSEDKRFRYHCGVDPIAISRAMYNNIKLGYFAQGGSTITQQLAKNIYFSFEKKMERKIAELIAVFDIERKLTKNEILELYINIIYFGENCYGLKDAAEHYYGVKPQNLSTDQCEKLVFTIKSPNNYNPNIYKTAV